jgi:hypothetical protein
MRYFRPILLWCLCAVLVAAAQDADLSVLQNLPAVGVAVRGLSSDGAKLGLTETALIATVREAIEPVGVKVIPPHARAYALGSCAGDHCQREPCRQTSYFFIVDLQLREPLKPVRPHRTLVTVPAVTWAEQTGGVTAKAENVQAALARLAQRFAEEWEQAQRAGGV